MTDELKHVWPDADLSTLEGRVAAALEAATWATDDGEHHKVWVIDQMVRMLTGCPTVEAVNNSAVGGPYRFLEFGENDEYRAWVRAVEGDPENEDEYYGEWDTGIAP